MRNLFVTCLMVCFTMATYAQSAYWVMLSDKGEQATHKLNQVAENFSPQALALRKEKNISFNMADVPVESSYVHAIEESGIEVLSTSRWINAVAVHANACDLDYLESLSFVKGIRPCASFVANAYEENILDIAELSQVMGDEYGKGQTQVDMINVPAFHAKGFRGKGVRIAILDAGFPGVDSIKAFDKIRKEGRVIATYDFVENDEFVYHQSSHGTNVMSCIGTDVPGKLIGTAPDASFVLCRTEDSRSETQVEEYNFLRAVEWCDSVGVDILHASLGYTKFDDGIGSYTYQDLDGDKAIVTRAVDLAASKGILCTISAGNEGRNSWHYIAAPCDADSVLCVGSVDKYEKKSGFSSFGPTADGRIKPDVMAMGSYTAIWRPNNRQGNSSGTSFSGPLMAGFMACLMHANPDAEPMNLIQATRMSGDQAGLPDNEYGYGIPDLVKADSLMKSGSNLYEMTIAQAEKPVRGKVNKTGDAPGRPVITRRPRYTKNPVTQITKTATKIKFVPAEGQKIENISIRQKGEHIDLPKSVLKVKGSKAILKTKSMKAGRYELKIKTDKVEELIPFRL
ncbi:MAG: S8 family serine peptidase [Bacteroidota bacterium]